jgi:two-component system OmpR family sensor kinase/two-component system sensor histidine kinase BaeS
MNLQTKVLLTFVVVIGIALLTASLITGDTVNRTYRGYLSSAFQQQMTWLADEAAARYAQTGSWDDVQRWLDSTVAGRRGTGMMGRGQGRGMMGGGAMSDPGWVIVDAQNGQALARGIDIEPVAPAEGAAIAVDGEIAARLIASNHGSMMYGPAEQAVVNQVNRTIWIAALVAALAALVVGGLLTSNLLRPLRQLQAGVAQVAQGQFDIQVDVQNRDEIGQLAASFNRMTANLHKQEDLRQRLVADIAHELRTPISVAQGNLQAILDGVYPLEESEIRTVYDEIGLLARLVNDLHELAQAEAGNLSLSLQPIFVNEVLQQMSASFRSLVEQKGVRLDLQSPPTVLQVLADANRLQQVLYNLLGNALRHTAAGGVITLSAATTESAGKSAVRFSVQDSGVGIDPADLPYVFERFYRADKQRARSDGVTNGSGLGLAIVKSLIEAHGGRVGVESRPGTGSIFWFELRQTDK